MKSKSTTFTADFIRGITATALPAEHEERIERHSAQQQGLAPLPLLFYCLRSERKAVTGIDGERFPQAA